MAWRRAWIAVVLALLLALVSGAPSSAAGPSSRWHFRAGDQILGIAVSLNGKYVAVASRDDNLYFFTRSGKLLWKYTAGNAMQSVSMTPDASFIASVSQDDNAYFFNRAGKRLFKLYLGYNLSGVSVAPQGNVLYATSRVLPVLYVLSPTGHILRQISLPVEAPAVSVSPDGSRVLLPGNDDFLYNDTVRGRVLWKFPAYNQWSVASWSPHGHYIVAGDGQGGVLYLLDPSGKPLWQFNTKDVIQSASVSAGARLVVVSTADSGVTYLLNRDGKVVWQYTSGQTNPATSVALSPNGRTLYVGFANGTLTAYDVHALLGSYTASEWAARAAVVAAAAVVALLGAYLVRWFRTTKEGQTLWRQLYRNRMSYLMLVPIFALLITFSYWPAISGLYHSLYNWNPGGRSYFVGLQNFEQMTTDPYLRIGIVNMLILMAFGLIVGGLLVPIFMAELLYHTRSRAMQQWFRTLLIAPMVVPGVAGLLIWQNMYDPNVGLINVTLRALHLGNLAHDWLGDPHWALRALIFMGFPFSNPVGMLIYYAGLLAIPTEVMDSAQIDGASLLRTIWNIHLPQLIGQVRFVVITGVIGGLQAFGTQLVMTGGGPEDSTYVPALQMYYAATRFDEYGYASAIAVVLFLVILGVTIVQFRVIRPSYET